jgi:hypothetical protein
VIASSSPKERLHDEVADLLSESAGMAAVEPLPSDPQSPPDAVELGELDGLDLDACFAAMSDDDAIAVGQRWRELVSSARRIDQVEKAGLSAGLDIREEKNRDVHIQQSCSFLNFGNMKVIDVDVTYARQALGFGHEQFAPFVQKTSVEDTEIDVHQDGGKFCFYLIDDVDVDLTIGGAVAALSVDRTLQVASLVEALDELGQCE